ncbi:TIGR04338 family metallohydrolase [Nakamurella deserti]|uniref:TIGR04338 family metallohydrolase n=1 Tax=Nakamurella deserti TaxID=2164074 RepID=UPI000DBE478A|nr:TIGR04338 family metallohydrolase [Nakamurella deserti]
MPEIRDGQRSLVYDAEHLVHRLLDRSADFPVVEVAGSRITLPVERRFASLDAVQHYLDRVRALPTVRQRWPRAAVPATARERQGGGMAHYERADAVIAVPGATHGSQWALRELVVLHELAHHLADEVEPAHGGAFVARLVDLVDVVMGAEAAFLLRVTFLENGVRIG